MGNDQTITSNCEVRRSSDGMDWAPFSAWKGLSFEELGCGQFGSMDVLPSGYLT